MDDWQLLQEFAKDGSETAFRELVTRHLNLVYSSALRQINDSQLAEEVAQAVFILLAQKAARLSRGIVLTGWLFRTTRFVATRTYRSESRRRLREQKAFDMQSTFTPDDTWKQIAPTLDEALAKLGETDRNAVLLYYVEEKTHAQVGRALGLSEEAARKRSDRALEKLRGFFASRGFSVSGAALGSVISTNAAQTAPAHLAATVTTKSLASTGTGTLLFSKFMTTTNLKLGLGALVTTGAIVALVAQHQTQSALRAENQSLAAQLSQLKADNADLSNRTASAGNSPSLSEEEQAELLKLRGEVTQLRAMKNTPAVARTLITNNLPVAKKTEIFVKARFVSIPKENGPAFEAGWTSAGTDASLLSEQQFGTVISELQARKADLLNEGEVTTLSGRQAQFQVADTVPINGTNFEVGPLIDVVPFYSSDSSMFTLDLIAMLNLLTGDTSQPGFVTTQMSNQVSVLPGQTVALRADLPAGGWESDSKALWNGPRELLVFVTPKLIDASGNILAPSTPDPGDPSTADLR